ncbi:NAD-dependent epimerase/dehydratase family protein [Sciscionella marina]|uniref:NAD-dependent epimerase/dehydratase family protein n=1 Tax=Sciscionella marina TaxID=508770 RepID=UPI000362A551|nr:NAD-dependent epimerase/dehydratase family protein [Sciscionella marina]
MTNEVHVVLGAGPAGTALATELAGRGHRVRLGARTHRGAPITGVQRVTVDVSDREQLRAAAAGAAVLYHCVNVPYQDQVALMPGIQEAILDAASEAGARLVVLDTLYPYGDTHGAPMTERTPMTATTAKGRMRAELDRVYLAAHEQGRVSVALGRAADFFGPGVLNSTLGGGVFPGAITGGEIVALGDIELPHSYSFIEDVATGLATLGENPHGDGLVWHLPAAPAVSTREILDRIGTLLGTELEPTVLAEPRPAGPFDATLMTEYAELFYQNTTSQIMVTDAFTEAFGVTATPLSTALERTVDWYRGFLS